MSTKNLFLPKVKFLYNEDVEKENLNYYPILIKLPDAQDEFLSKAAQICGLSPTVFKSSKEEIEESYAKRVRHFLNLKDTQ